MLMHKIEIWCPTRVYPRSVEICLSVYLSIHPSISMTMSVVKSNVTTHRCTFNENQLWITNFTNTYIAKNRKSSCSCRHELYLKITD